MGVVGKKEAYIVASVQSSSFCASDLLAVSWSRKQGNGAVVAVLQCEDGVEDWAVDGDHAPIPADGVVLDAEEARWASLLFPVSCVNEMWSIGRHRS